MSRSSINKFLNQSFSLQLIYHDFQFIYFNPLAIFQEIPRLFPQQLTETGMKDSTASSSSHLTPDISIDNQNNTLVIKIENPKTFEKYNGNYSYEKLPIQFKVLFENLNQFYLFLTQNIEEKVRAEKGTLHIGVNIVGKDKQFLLPLDEIALTPEQELKKQVWQLENQLLQQNSQISTLQTDLKEKENLLEEKEKIIFTMSGVLKEKEMQLLKMANKIRHLQSQLQDILCQEKPNKLEQNQLQESKMTEEFTPIKKTVNNNSKSRKMKQIQEFGHKLLLRLDQTSKHYNKFKISGNEVQKLHGPTYQIFHNAALPRQGKFYFDIRIILIKNNNIVVGVISDKSKDEQFSFKKMNCVCYNGYDGSICEQDKQKYVNVKPKEGNKIRTVIDMTTNVMEWYIMGGDQRMLIGKALIPASMVKQPLYPYFQLYWEGNKVRLNS